MASTASALYLCIRNVVGGAGPICVAVLAPKIGLQVRSWAGFCLCMQVHAWAVFCLYMLLSAFRFTLPFAQALALLE